MGNSISQEQKIRQLLNESLLLCTLKPLTVFEQLNFFAVKETKRKRDDLKGYLDSATDLLNGTTSNDIRIFKAVHECIDRSIQLLSDIQDTIQAPRKLQRKLLQASRLVDQEMQKMICLS